MMIRSWAALLPLSAGVLIVLPAVPGVLPGLILLRLSRLLEAELLLDILLGGLFAFLDLLRMLLCLVLSVILQLVEVAHGALRFGMLAPADPGRWLGSLPQACSPVWSSTSAPGALFFTD